MSTSRGVSLAKITGMGTGVEFAPANVQGVSLSKPQRATFRYGYALITGTITQRHETWIMVKIDAAYRPGDDHGSPDAWLVGRDWPVAISDCLSLD